MKEENNIFHSTLVLKALKAQMSLLKDCLEIETKILRAQYSTQTEVGKPVIQWRLLIFLKLYLLF